ncbi:MAG: FkbM family methyltransferase [Solirubrobacteraceae bacterium]|nr:FkbM family methyltransferase [Solirubrobacteraceae bacterium]
MAHGPAHELLRPAKIANAARRRVFERSLARAPIESRMPMVHLGTGYGGWWIPADTVTADWCCYSVGTGADVSFDVELLQRYGARVRAFDPYPRFGEMALEAAGHDPRYSFHPYAITAGDGPIELFGRQDEEAGSVSAVNLYGTRQAFVRSGRSLPSLMHEFGDNTVELLKLDVEGSEYEVLPTLNLDTMGTLVLCVELHHNESAGRARALLDDLRIRGFEIAARKDPTSFTLVRS